MVFVKKSNGLPFMCKLSKYIMVVVVCVFIIHGSDMYSIMSSIVSCLQGEIWPGRFPTVRDKETRLMCDKFDNVL